MSVESNPSDYYERSTSEGLSGAFHFVLRGTDSLNTFAAMD